MGAWLASFRACPSARQQDDAWSMFDAGNAADTSRAAREVSRGFVSTSAAAIARAAPAAFQ
jgi:hypothetical protein